MPKDGAIRVGIGGWTFEPWRGTFFPEKWPKTKELDYAAAKMTAIEVNGTYYGSQKPATFANWAKAAPKGFVFSLKASRYCTNRKVLAEGEASVQKFLSQGITELGDKLGPILWQFMPTKRFDPDDFAAFLALLPKSQDGLALTHVLDVRHESFVDPAFVALVRAHGASIVHTDSPDFPPIGDPAGAVHYCRLMNAREEEPTGYASAEIDQWVDAARGWAKGEAGTAFPLAAPADPAPVTPRDVYLFYINGAKIRAPHGAMATIETLGGKA